jgi:hypothetical protein
MYFCKHLFARLLSSSDAGSCGSPDPLTRLMAIDSHVVPVMKKIGGEEH